MACPQCGNDKWDSPTPEGIEVLQEPNPAEGKNGIYSCNQCCCVWEENVIQIVITDEEKIGGK